MDTLNEYALLIAVAIPFVALVALNVALWFGGERGTLVLPSAAPYRAAIPRPQSPVDSGAGPVIPAEAGMAANDEYAREAA